MNDTYILDCNSCVVSSYSDSSKELFCQRCCQKSQVKEYYIALHDQQSGLVPFVALNDANQAEIYAKRLGLRGVSHILMRWNPEQKSFAAVDRPAN